MVGGDAVAEVVHQNVVCDDAMAPHKLHHRVSNPKDSVVKIISIKKKLFS